MNADSKKACWFGLLFLGLALAQHAVCAEQAGQQPKLLLKLPDFAVTADGMAVDPKGNLIVACPNFIDKTKPGCLVRIDRKLEATKWLDIPVLKETGVACPTAIAFGSDGDLYVCDNQGWTGSEKGQFKGRILRLKVRDNTIVSTTVVAEGMEHPMRIRIRYHGIYVTQSQMSKVKDPSGLMVSAVYRFKLDDKNVKITNTLEDKNIITTFLTTNRSCQYGADGLAFDTKGNLYVGNFGDGKIHKVVFDAQGDASSNTVFAKTDFDYALDLKSPGFLAKATTAKMRTTAGICADHNDNLYVADFSNNALVKVTSKGGITVLARNGDSDGNQGELDQPCEPIVWNNMIVVSNFDLVSGPDKVNTKHELPVTLSAIPLR
jgi:sugar lactone lactonase YvrE